jgi:hypothetical protein
MTESRKMTMMISLLILILCEVFPIKFLRSVSYAIINSVRLLTNMSFSSRGRASFDLYELVSVENNNRNVTENANINKLKMTFKEALMTGSKSTVRNRPLSKDIETKSKKEDKRETN